MQAIISDMRGLEKDFDYGDGGEQYDWSSISMNLSEGKEPKTWLRDNIKQVEEQETVGLELPDVSALSLNDNQRTLVILVLHTLYTWAFVENQLDYRPLRLVVSRTAGMGKSYVIKCLQRLVRLLFGKNELCRS